MDLPKLSEAAAVMKGIIRFRAPNLSPMNPEVKRPTIEAPFNMETRKNALLGSMPASVAATATNVSTRMNFSSSVSAPQVPLTSIHSKERPRH